MYCVIRETKVKSKHLAKQIENAEEAERVYLSKFMPRNLFDSRLLVANKIEIAPIPLILSSSKSPNVSRNCVNVLNIKIITRKKINSSIDRDIIFVNKDDFILF